MDNISNVDVLLFTDSVNLTAEVAHIKQINPEITAIGVILSDIKYYHIQKGITYKGVTLTPITNVLAYLAKTHIYLSSRFTGTIGNNLIVDVTFIDILSDQSRNLIRKLNRCTGTDFQWSLSPDSFDKKLSELDPNLYNLQENGSLREMLNNNEHIEMAKLEIQFLGLLNTNRYGYVIRQRGNSSDVNGIEYLEQAPMVSRYYTMSNADNTQFYYPFHSGDTYKVLAKLRSYKSAQGFTLGMYVELTEHTTLELIRAIESVKLIRALV